MGLQPVKYTLLAGMGLQPVKYTLLAGMAQQTWPSLFLTTLLAGRAAQGRRVTFKVGCYF